MKHLIWLVECCELSPVKIIMLLEHCGNDAQHVWRLSATEAAQAAGLTQSEALKFAGKSLYLPEKIIALCRRRNIDIVSILDEGYPALLKNITDPPIVLYVRGKLPSFEKMPSLTVVGHRKAGAYGLMQARRFAGTLSRQGFIIVSGMAEGIDSAAHRGALEGGSPTVAVFGTAIDRCYPRSNVGLMRDIIANGAVISEYPPGKKTYASSFPYRNRIMSGLTMGTLVVEATEKSGSLITADHAANQGREVFVIPGNIDDPLSQGSNELIKSGATVVTDPLDVINGFGGEWTLEEKDAAPDNELYEKPLTLENVYEEKKTEEVKLDGPSAELLGKWEGTVHIDDIVRSSGLDASRVASMLTVLEIKKVIRRLPGGFIEKLI